MHKAHEGEVVGDDLDSKRRRRCLLICLDGGDPLTCVIGLAGSIWKTPGSWDEVFDKSLYSRNGIGSIASSKEGQAPASTHCTVPSRLCEALENQR